MTVQELATTSDSIFGIISAEYLIVSVGVGAVFIQALSEVRGTECFKFDNNDDISSSAGSSNILFPLDIGLHKQPWSVSIRETATN